MPGVASGPRRRRMESPPLGARRQGHDTHVPRTIAGAQAALYRLRKPEQDLDLARWSDLARHRPESRLRCLHLRLESTSSRPRVPQPLFAAIPLGQSSCRPAGGRQRVRNAVGVRPAARLKATLR